jgi:hypothetical protein
MNKIVLTLLACLLIVSGTVIVVSNTYKIAESDIYLPTPEEPSNFQMEALATGTLILDDKYILLKGTCPFDRAEMLLIWPYGYSVDVEKWKIRILDDNGDIVARVGDHAKIGGGIIPLSQVEKVIGESLPDSWEGDCWLVGKIVSS